MPITPNDIGPAIKALQIKDCDSAQLIYANVSPTFALDHPNIWVHVPVELSLEEKIAMAKEQNDHENWAKDPTRDQEDGEKKFNLTPKDRAIIVEMHKLFNRLQLLENKGERPLNQYLQQIIDTYISIKNE